MPVIAISTGEPAGIGPDICLALAGTTRLTRFVALGDPQLLRERAQLLRCGIDVRTLHSAAEAGPHVPGVLQVIEHRLRTPACPGRLDASNSPYVVDLLTDGGRGCLEGRYAALVTAPVHKGVIAEAGIAFTGHTEFLARLCGAEQPVMLLARGKLRVALVTTHMPLRAVADAITAQRIRAVAQVLCRDLVRLFGIERPRVLVLGLNPHAGEGGHLGTEERDIIEPCLARLREAGLDLTGPRPADTAFTAESLQGFDAVLAMYHDQGLAPLKSMGFGDIVNVTLGLPIVRTSVDHGTALPLAGTGRADPRSLECALTMAETIVRRQAAA